MKPISVNNFTGQTEKVIYVFHGNWDSLDMIFITVIQPKMYQENSHPENSHPSNYPLENSQPENSGPENSHLKYSYPCF